jgi:ABC-type multidrug transport system fused ATPase/permease subunit
MSPKVGPGRKTQLFIPGYDQARKTWNYLQNKGINYIKSTKIELVGLTDRQNSKFSTFSLEMKQRLAIASALLNDPEISRRTHKWF